MVKLLVHTVLVAFMTMMCTFSPHKKLIWWSLYYEPIEITKYNSCDPYVIP